MRFTTQPPAVYIEEDQHALGWCYQIMIENRGDLELSVVAATTRLLRGTRLVLEETFGPGEIARHAKPGDAARLWFRPEEYVKPYAARIAPGGKLRWSDNVGLRPRGCPVTRAVHSFVFAAGKDRLLEAQCTVRLRPNRQATRLRLPFDGWWQMLIGHEHFEHHMRGGGGMGLDFIGLDDGGAPHRGTGQALDHWPCYGRDVLAPAAGVVTGVVDGNPDSPPGRPLRVGHNGVSIDHGNGERTFLAHFIPGSIVVRQGETVVAGQKLGLCGSSGYSLCPHVHIGLSRHGIGVPVVFSNYLLLWPVEDAPDQFSLVQRVNAGVIRHGAIVRHAGGERG